MTRNQLLSALSEVEHLANAGKLTRLAHAPFRYLSTAYFNKFTYPRTRTPLQRMAINAYGLPFTVALPAGTDIYLTGGKTHLSEIKLARFLVRHLKPNDHYVDVGAHYGYFSGLAAALKQEIKITCFEPAPDTSVILRKNLGGLPLEIRQKGLADAKNHLTFYQFPAQYSEYNSLDVEQYQQEEWFTAYPPKAVQVDISTLDLEFSTPPDFLKIDVEGVEDRVITGGSNLLRQGKTVIIMEYLPSSISNGSHQRAFQLLIQWSYQAHQLTLEGELQPCPDPESWMKLNHLDSANLVFCQELPLAVV